MLASVLLNVVVIMLTPCCHKKLSDKNGDWTNLCCLEYARQFKHFWNEHVYVKACKVGDAVAIRYAFDHACPIDTQLFDVGHCLNLESLMAMRALGCTWNELTCARFASRGQIDCLRYAHENGCLWDERTTTAAGMYGHLHCLRYAHEEGCGLSESFCLKVVEHKSGTIHLHCQERVQSHIECLKYGIDHGAVTTHPKLMIAAARYYCFLTYLHSLGLPVTKDVTLEAVKVGTIECFRYCVEHKFPRDVGLCLLVARSLKSPDPVKAEEIVKYFVEHSRKTCKCFTRRQK